MDQHDQEGVKRVLVSSLISAFVVRIYPDQCFFIIWLNLALLLVKQITMLHVSGMLIIFRASD